MAHLSIKNACRVCLNVSERSKLLYQHPTIVEKLYFVGGPLQFEDSVEVPKYICNECEAELEFAYKFFIQMKPSKLRNSVITDTERKVHDKQMFSNEEDSKSDFKVDIQIIEDLQANGDHDNDVHEDILKMSSVESSSVIQLDKRPTLVLDDMAI